MQPPPPPPPPRGPCWPRRFLGRLALVALLQVDCPLPPNPAGAKKKDIETLTKFLIGMVMQYDCDTGYKRVPGTNNSIRCDVNSQWTQPEEFCKESCPLPPSVVGARLQKEFQDLEYFPARSIVKYDCTPGFKRVPYTDNSVTCSDDFKWSTHALFCEASCSEPPVLRYATLRPGFQRTDYFPYGTVIEYDCNAGYTRVPGTKNSIICTTAHHWSNPEDFCTDSCPLPPNLRHAKLQEEFVGLKNFYVGAVVKYDCIGIYKHDPQTKNSISCCNTLQWSQPEEFCKESCPLPPNLIDSKLKKEFQSLQYFPVDRVVTYDCNEGYQHINGTDNSLSCRTTLLWSQPGKFCEEVECDDAIIEHGVKLTGFKNKHNYGNNIAFECNIGYFMVGSYLIHCGDNSMWKPEVPSCEKINPKFCGAPLVPSGSVHPLQPQYELGTRVVIQCKPQYSFPDETMEMSTVCHGHNLWKPPAKPCMFRTSPDTSVLTIYNGRIIHGKKKIYKPGDNVTIKCHPGYWLKGPSVVRYIGGKKWSPSSPYCFLNFFFILLIAALVFFILLVLAKRFNQIYSQERESTPWT